MNLATLAKRALANALTVARLCIGLCYFWLPVEWRLPAIVVAAFTDLVDGWISRFFQATSTFGKVLDPIADKTCVLAVVVTLLYDDKLKFWELLFVAQRDLMVLGIAVVVLMIDRHKLREMPPRLMGKVATAGQFVFLVAQLKLESPPGFLLILVAVLSGAAAIDYLIVAVTAFRSYKAARGENSLPEGIAEQERPNQLENDGR